VQAGHDVTSGGSGNCRDPTKLLQRFGFGYESSRHGLVGSKSWLRRRPSNRPRRPKGNGWSKQASRKGPGGNGGLTSASASGEQSARTTARTETRGITSATIKRAHARIIGARTVSLGSVTITSGYVLRWRCGTEKIR